MGEHLIITLSIFPIGKAYTPFHQTTDGSRNMSIMKGLFGNKKQDAAPPPPQISVAPGASTEEQTANRERMEAELAASRAAREARKTES